jgi:MFS family permease
LLVGRRAPTTAVARVVDQRAGLADDLPSRLWWAGWLGHAFAAGLTGIAWEVLAFRLVENIVKSRAQTFAIILGVFLAGLAFGGLVGDRLRDRLGSRRRAVFLASQTAMYVWLAGSVVGLIYGLEHWHVARPWLAYIAAYEPDAPPVIAVANYGLLPLLVLFIPALFMGVGFSLSQQLLQTSSSAVGRRLGRVQFVNIVGCVAGATLTTQVAIPWVGTSGGLKAVAAIGLAYAAVWWSESARRWVPGGVAVLLVAAIVAVPAQDHLWRVLSGQREPGRLLYLEDASGVSSIRFRPSLRAEADVFANGLGQSVLPRPLDPHHVLLGAVPTLLHPRPARVGIIGVGSGGTLWGASASPATERVVAWEIMAGQPALLAAYATRTEDASVSWFLRDPRIDIRHADGRHALRVGEERFDVIEADALRPSSGYAGNLYSVEFFRLVQSRLTPGGYAASWVPTPRVLETMRRVFPHVVYLGQLVALGSDAPIEIDWTAVRARLQVPAVKAHFAAGNIDIAELMEPLAAESTATLPPLGPFDPSQVNTDMHPRDELPAPGRIARLLLGR